MSQDQSLFYHSVETAREINLSEIHSLYYFELTHKDILETEFHHFWELVYVDEGQIVVSNNDRTYLLSQGELFIHSPDSPHRLTLTENIQPNIFIASFTLENPEMARIQDRPIFTTMTQRRILSSVLNETQSLYGPFLDFHRDLTKDMLPTAKFASLQMIGNQLEILLIELIRSCLQKEEIENKISAITEEQRNELLLNKMKNFMLEHLDGTICFQDICQYMGMSGTALKALFRTKNKQGIMHSYQQLRIREACRLLRDGSQNVTEIAEILGYPSCQAFSAHFSRILGVCPTQYLKQIKENRLYGKEE